MKILPTTSGGSSSSTLIIIILAMVLLPVEGLMCWSCMGNAAPLCDPGDSLKEGHSKKGVSEKCPHPDDPTVNPGDNSTFWSCYIMELVVKDTGRVEIYKGCTRHYGAFTREHGGYLGTANGTNIPIDCYKHNELQLPKRLHFHEVKICICTDDDCNKRTIKSVVQHETEIIEIGLSDIEYKLNVRKSAASIPKVGFIVVGVASFLRILHILVTFT